MHLIVSYVHTLWCMCAAISGMLCLESEAKDGFSLAAVGQVHGANADA
jgi:hypothetical protein